MVSNAGGRQDAPRDERQHEPDLRSRPQEAPRVRGIVLAGVHAWGGCVLEEVVPRPLLPVANRPLISHVITWLRDSGVPGVSICANSDTGAMRRAFADGSAWNVSLDYWEDVMPRGPAGCARDAAMQSDVDTFVVVDGTIVPDLDLPALLRSHFETRAALTIVVTSSATGNGNGDGSFTPVGIYVFSRAAMEHIPASGYQDIKEVLIPRLHQACERVVPYVVPGEAAYRVRGAESYLAVSAWVIERLARNGNALRGYRRVGDAQIHESARLDPTVRVVGPVLIGPNTVVEPGAIVIGATAISGGCTIGAGAVVSRCAIWAGCRVGPGVFVDHCILTDGSIVEGETSVRNTMWTTSRSAFRDTPWNGGNTGRTKYQKTLIGQDD